MTYRCRQEYEELFSCASVYTDDAVNAAVEKSILKIVPGIHIQKNAHGMGSEDFAEITQRVPSAYYTIGAGPEDASQRLGQHNPKIIFNEDILSVGAAIYAQTAMDWLAENC